MDDHFKIYVHRLQECKPEIIDTTFSPEMMDIQEQELQFNGPVVVRGEAVVSSGEMLLTLAVETTASMSCSICLGQVEVPLRVPQLFHCEKVDEITSGVFSMRDLLRQALLLEVPHTAECAGGSCPERESVQKFFKTSGESHHPFEQLGE